MQEWEFDVGVSTHELLRKGVVVRHYARVLALVVTYTEARLVAC